MLMKIQMERGEGARSTRDTQTQPEGAGWRWLSNTKPLIELGSTVKLLHWNKKAVS